MSIVFAWLFGFAMLLPYARSGPFVAPESGEEREARLAMIVGVNLEVASSYVKRSQVPALALAITVTEHAESGGFDLRIHAGDHHPRDTQDHGRARCMGQIHPSKWFPRPVWSSLAGVDREATVRCSSAVARLLLAAMGTCGVAGRFDEPALAMAFAQYGSGHSCEPTKDSRFRACMWTKAFATLKEKR